MSAPEPCILGIDPGLSGAIAFYFPSRPGMIGAEDMPIVAGEVNAAEMGRRIAQMRPDIAIVEKVGSMPGQGVASTFRFGTAYGVVLGVLGALAVPVHLVSPGKWKRHFGLSADKEESRARAIRQWPGSPHFARKKDHGRAEAALLAKYGAEVLAAAYRGAPVDA